MKRGLIIFVALFLCSLSFVAAECNPKVSMINQDPYPAVPGESAKVVFQVAGELDSDCGDLTIELLETYPIRVDPSTPSKITVKSDVYIKKEYGAFVMAPYKIRIAEDAFDGDTPIELLVSTRTVNLLESFDLNIEDSRADFEAYITDYNYATKELTIEVLNIEDSDIEALTIEIPKQENIIVKGPNRVVVGDLDSNEYSTADFEATVKDGEIMVNLIYSDSINVRRTVQKTLVFDSSYFQGRVGDKKENSLGTYIIVLIIIAGAGYYFYNKRKKKKHSSHHR